MNTTRCAQAMLAVGLLQLRPWKPRFVGFLGTVASLINCVPSPLPPAQDHLLSFDSFCAGHALLHRFPDRGLL